MRQPRGTEAGTSGSRWNRQQRLAGLAISGIAVAILFSTVDVAATAEVLRHAQPGYLALALLALAAQVAVRGWRWSVLLPPRPSGDRVPLRRTISPLLIGYLGNALLPARLGEPIRAFLVARREGLVPLEAFGATMLERLVDVVVLAVIGLAAAVILDAEWWMVTVGLVGSLGGLAVLVLLVALGFGRLVHIIAAASLDAWAWPSVCVGSSVGVSRSRPAWTAGGMCPDSSWSRSRASWPGCSMPRSSTSWPSRWVST